MSSRREYEMMFKLNAQLGSNYNAAFVKAQEQVAAMQKEIVDLGKTQSDISAYQKQQSAIDATQKKLDMLNQEHDNIQEEIKETEGFSSQLANQLLSKKQAIEKTTAALEQQTQKAQQMGATLRSAGVDTKNLAQENERLAAECKELQARQQGVINSFEDSGESAKVFGNETVAAVESVQQALVAAGVATLIKEIGEAMVECTQASIKFESAVTGVYKTVDGSEQQLAAIADEIKEMSTEIPATTEEIAGVAEAAGQLGIATQDVMDFTSVMINLGESTNLTADDAATALAKFANITGTAAANYSRLGSVIVDLGNNYATTEADIVAMSTRLASAGTLAGLTEAEIMALSAAMSSVGIEAEAGGTAMTQTLSKIETAVVNNGDSLAEFARIAGMSAQEFATSWENAPIVAIQAFIAGLGKLDEQGESSVLVLDELGLTGVRQSNMLKSLGLASNTLSSAIKTANKAWNENTALTAEASKRYATTESKLAMLNNAYGNLQIAIGDVYTPALQEASEFGAEFLDGITEFVEKNPEVVRALTSLGVGLVATGVAIGGVALATKIATPVVAAFNAVLAMNPIVLITAGIVGLTVAVASFAAMAEDSAIPSVEELTVAAEAMNEVVESSTETYDDSVASTMAAVNVAENYITKLKELEEAGIDTDEEAQQYHNTLVLLCQVVPELSSYIDLETDTIKGGTDALEANTEAWKQNALQQAHQEYLTSVMKAYSDVLVEAEKNSICLTAATQEREMAEQKVKEVETRLTTLLEEADKKAKHLAETEGYLGTGAELVSQEHAQLSLELRNANAELAEAISTENAYKKAIEESSDEVETARTEIDLAAEAVNNLTAVTGGENKSALLDWKDAAQTAFDAVQTDMEELVQEYGEVYEAALSSLEGQFGLFDEASMKSEEYKEATVKNAQEALNSQLAYWESYSENLTFLQGMSAEQLGTTEENYAALLSLIQDGSAESAGLAANMVKQIEKGNEDAVAELADTLGKVQAERDEIATSTAEWLLDFDGKMDELTQTMEETVDGLQLDDEAAAAAKATIQAYADEILAQQDSAVDAATQVANAVAAALNTPNISQIVSSYNTFTPDTRIPVETFLAQATGSIPGYAVGTTNAERGIAVVGEDGPELVFFNGGERVLTAAETAAITATDVTEARYETRYSDGGSSPISVEVNIHVEGNASDQTVESLYAYGEEFSERVRSVIAEVQDDDARRRY